MAARDLDASYETLLEAREHLKPWLPWAAEISLEGQREFLEQAVRHWESGEAFGIALPGVERVDQWCGGRTVT